MHCYFCVLINVLFDNDVLQTNINENFKLLQVSRDYLPRVSPIQQCKKRIGTDYLHIEVDVDIVVLPNLMKNSEHGSRRRYWQKSHLDHRPQYCFYQYRQKKCGDREHFVLPYVACEFYTLIPSLQSFRTPLPRLSKLKSFKFVFNNSALAIKFYLYNVVTRANMMFRVSKLSLWLVSVYEIHGYLQRFPQA